MHFADDTIQQMALCSRWLCVALQAEGKEGRTMAAAESGGGFSPL